MNAVFSIKGKVIETSRLFLRPFCLDDLDDFYHYASVEGIGERAGWAHHQNIDESLQILNLFIANDNVFAIVDKSTNRVIGSLSVEKYRMEDKLTEFDNYLGRELGFVLSKDFWGKGLATEAVNGVVDYLFNELNIDFLLCGYYNFNYQSKHVQEKCGFKPYRSLVMETKMGTKEQGTLNLLINPNKNIQFNFSHPETLIWKSKCKTITICGSIKFFEDFNRERDRLISEGNIVLSVAQIDNSAQLTNKELLLLKELHKRKIYVSDEIFVINKNGYIGDSTRDEIGYAKSLNKKVVYLENNFENEDSLEFCLEESAMAVVLCNGKILTTLELVYGTKRLSLPKGHVEITETSLDAAIREAFEETNIVITKASLIKQLNSYCYEFVTPSNKMIRKTITPYLFEINDFGSPLAKEERILSVQWMNVDDFLSLCPYDNVKCVVEEVISIVSDT